jgi:hypothetical protein
MSNITLTESHVQQLSMLNSVIESAEPRLSSILTFDNLVNEAHALRVIESNIPESLKFDLHLDMILRGGSRSVTDYYKSMSNGTNYILEAARKVFPNDSKITESIESFKEYMISMLNEDSLALGNPIVSAGGIDTALAGGPLQPRAGSGFWSVLKGLWNAVTEGGSLIGIVHFIIDIVGLFGDFIFPGVGVCADLINAAIYAIRGEWMLCAISVIAAVVIGFGDALKLVKFAAKPAEKVAMACAKGQTKQAAEMMAKMSAKESGGVMKILTQIFGNIGGALGKATSLIGKLTQGIGKVVDYVPGLGPLLRPIFDGIGKVLTKFGEKMSLAGANFKLATTSAKEAAAVTIHQALKGGGGDIIFDGSWVKVVNKEGKQVGKYPFKQFEKIGADEFMEAAVKKAGDRESARILYKNGKDYARVTKTLEKDAVQDSMRKRAFEYFGTTAFWKGSKRMYKDFMFFIGKQIYKIIFKTDWIDGANNKWSEREVGGHGNGAFNDWIDNRIKDEMDEKGAVYLPALDLDSQDQEVVDKVTEYQNHYAKLYGQPTIMNVVTKTYDKEGATKEFAAFFDDIASGKVKRGGPGDKVDHSISDTLTEGRVPIVKKIMNFSDFNR